MKDLFHRGITWEDFPGNKDTVMRKIDFANFRRGVHPYNPEVEGLEGQELKLKLHELAAKKRKGFANSAFQFRARRRAQALQEDSDV